MTTKRLLSFLGIVLFSSSISLPAYSIGNFQGLSTLDDYFINKKSNGSLFQLLDSNKNSHPEETKNFYAQNLSKSDFFKAILPKAKFTASNLDSCNFRKAILNQAQFAQSNLKNSIFYEAQMQGAQFKQVNLQNACLEDAIATNTLFTDVNLQHANLVKANFTGSSFKQVNFSNAVLYGAILRDTKGANLSFSNAIIKVTDYNKYYKGLSAEYEFKKLTNKDIIQLSGFSESFKENLIKLNNANNDVAILIKKGR